MPLFLGQEDSTRQALHLLPKTFKRWVRDAVVNNAQARAEAKASRDLPGG